VRLTPAQWIELSTDGQTDFGAIGTVSTNPGVQGRQEDTLQNDQQRVQNENNHTLFSNRILVGTNYTMKSLIPRNPPQPDRCSVSISPS
jgi:hypothetical protein